MKVVCSFETSGSIYPTTCCNNPEDLLPQYENRFATNKIFQHCGSMSNFPHNVSISFAVVFLSVVNMSNQTLYCTMGHMLQSRGREFKWMLLRNNFAKCVCLYVSLCHIHVSNGDVWQEYSPSLPFSICIIQSVYNPRY